MKHRHTGRYSVHLELEESEIPEWSALEIHEGSILEMAERHGEDDPDADSQISRIWTEEELLATGGIYRGFPIVFCLDKNDGPDFNPYDPTSFQVWADLISKRGQCDPRRPQRAGKRTLRPSK